MGMIRHHAIVVTSFYKEEAHHWQSEAKAIFGQLVSDVIPGTHNGYFSFMIAPDGSKEFWPPSDANNEKRAKFLERLQTREFKGRAVEVAFGENGPYMVTGTVGCPEYEEC